MFVLLILSVQGATLWQVAGLMVAGLMAAGLMVAGLNYYIFMNFLSGFFFFKKIILYLQLFVLILFIESWIKRFGKSKKVYSHRLEVLFFA
jgi:uncharacterized membrane protein